MNNIYLAAMPGTGIADIEIFRVAGTCELDKDMLIRIILVIAPIDFTLTKPISCFPSAEMAQVNAFG